MDRKRIVVKVGSNILTTDTGAPDLENLASLVDQMCEIMKAGHEVVLVSSGAIVCGSEQLGIRPKGVQEEQAAAAVGQPLLMQEYSYLFALHGYQVGQILLTKDGIEDKTRVLHTKDTLQALVDYGVIPIINENDSVAIDEICFGDNDTLAGLVARVLEVDLLVLLSDVDAVYSGNPKLDSGAEKLSVVDGVSDDIFALVDDVQDGLSRGGMRSKLMCAKYATEQGIEVVIAHGRNKTILRDIVEGKDVGTRIRRKL